MILPFVETLVMIDTGSNVNLISKKLANILECNLYKVNEELNVTNGKTSIQEATTLSLVLFQKPRNGNQKLLLLHNIPFKVVPNPDYMLSLGKQMERRYRVPLNNLEEVTEIGETLLTTSNNNLGELMESKAIAVETRRKVTEGFNQEIPPPLLIEETNIEGRGSNNEFSTRIYPPSTSHHSLVTSVRETNMSFYTQPKEYQVTVGNEKEVQENEENIRKLLPKELMDYKDVFQIPKGLPPSRGKWDFKLDISDEDMKELPIAKPKSIGKEAEAATKEMLTQYLKDGWIEPVNIDHAVNMFPVPKQDGTWRYVYNYVPVNKICKINKNPIPNLKDNIDILASAKYVIALDLRAAYNQILITDKRTKEATAFITPFGIYQWNVMPFGLSDAPPHFQAFMNAILFDKIKNGVLVYLDDVLIYGQTKEECLKNTKWVLRQFRKNKLFCKIKKCEFFPEVTTYLRFEVSNGSYVPKNTNALNNLPKPTSLNELQKTLGIINWFSDSIPNYAEIFAPLFQCLSKYDQHIVDKNFSNCVGKIKIIPRFAIDYNNNFILITDASEISGSAILFQTFPGASVSELLKKLEQSKSSWKSINELIDKKKIKAINCFSHKFNDTESHYSAFDKELLTIIKALEHSSYFLRNSRQKIHVITDNAPSADILNGQNKKVVDNRRLRYIERLQPFNIVANHIKGKKNDLLDFLSRNFQNNKQTPN